MEPKHERTVSYVRMFEYINREGTIHSDRSSVHALQSLEPLNVAHSEVKQVFGQ